MRQGWEIKKLGEVVEFQRGLTYSKKDEISFSKNIVLRSNNIDLKTNKLDFTELKYINPSIIIAENKTVKKGSLVICMANGSKSHLGKVALIDSDYGYAFGGFMGLIKPKENLNPKFLLHLMTSEMYKKFIDGLSDGVNINNLKFSDLGEFEIPLPPLSEQQRIVSILDEVFIGIEKAKNNTEQNLKNAKELFESYLQGVFENGNWEEKKLSDLCDTGAGGTPLKSHKDYYQGGNVPWLRSGEVDKKDIVKCELFITEKGLKNSSARMFPKNTVLIAMYGATAGQVGILRFECSTNQAVCGILPNKNIIPEFLYYKFMAGKQALVDQAVGGAQPNISQIKIKNTLVPFISLKEQQTIVHQLDALRAETQKLEEIYQKKLENLEELKKSILQKAFTGELSTTN
jgi:type I restriction enzyme S subunit